MNEFLGGLFVVAFLCVVVVLVTMGFDFVATHQVPGVTVSILGGLVVIGVASSAIH